VITTCLRPQAFERPQKAQHYLLMLKEITL